MLSKRRIGGGVAAGFLAVCAAVHGAPPSIGTDPFDNVSPARLIDRLVPEDAGGLKTPAYFGVEETARAQVEAGLYRRAIYTLHGKPTTELAAIVRSRARAALGEWAEALAAVEKVGGEAEVQRARVLGAMGKSGEAIGVLREYLGKSPESLAGHYELGRLLELKGDMDGAKEAYGFFVKEGKNYLELWATKQEAAFKSADEFVLAGLALDRWATLTSQYRENTTLDRTILGMFVRAYDVVDRGNTSAHIAAARYLMGHDNGDQALEELGAAIKANPRLSEAYQLLGQISIERFNFEGADAAVMEMRKIDPQNIEADLVEARNFLAQRQPNLAEPILKGILTKRPERLEALGLLAACQALRVDDAGVEATIRRADAIAPKSALAYLELADQLGSMRQYPRAAAMYQVAMSRAPWWTEALNGLGLLYTQSGDEEKAKDVLEEARKLDPFNLRTTNYLRLLDRLFKMKVVSSDHFSVRFDPSTDPIIGQLMLEYMENVNADLVGIFQHQPAQSTLIEVFPTHAQFSVRTTGTPWIGTVGASTGRVIALVTPRDGGETMGTYNWAQVLRHEYTHTITLSATENRIPHWMTEGLAVWAEGTPLQWEWVPMLYQAVATDKLFTMDRITWGFVRPKRPIDRQLAYAQSYWMCKYLIDTYGKDAMLQMLARFKAGRTQDQAFFDVLGRTSQQFYEEFTHFAQQQIRSWGYDKTSSEQYKALREKGEEEIKLHKYKDALETWLEIAKLRPMDPLPHQRLAGLYLTKDVSDPKEARNHLAALAAVELKDDRFAKRLGRLSLTIDDIPAALKYAHQATWTDPYDMEAHKLLLEVAEKAKDEKLIELQKERIAALEALEAKREKQDKTPEDRLVLPVEPG